MLLRILVSAAILTIPFAILAIVSGKAEGAIWLMIPFIGLLPVLLLSSLLFIPVERLSARYGLSPNLAVVLIGVGIGALIAVAATYFGKEPSVVLGKLRSGDISTIGAYLGMLLAGAMIGASWRASKLLTAYFGWAQ